MIKKTSLTFLNFFLKLTIIISVFLVITTTYTAIAALVFPTKSDNLIAGVIIVGLIYGPYSWFRISYFIISKYNNFIFKIKQESIKNQIISF